MAFSDILKRQKSSDGGILSAIILTSSDGQDNLNSVSKSTELTAKNTSVLPSIAKSMLSIQNNIAKLVKLQTETVKQRQQGFFSQQRAREDLYESRFGSRSSSPSAVSGREKKDASGFGFLGGIGSFISTIFGALLSKPMLATVGIGALVGYLFNDPKFREGIKSIIVGTFSAIAEGFSGLKDVFNDEEIRQSFKSVIQSFFSALGAFLSLPVGEILGVEVSLGEALIGVIGLLGAFKAALFAATIRLGMLGLGGGVPPILSDGYGGPEDERKGRGRRGPGRSGRVSIPPAVSGGAGQGKPLTDFGTVGANREIEKNKSAAQKIRERLARIRGNPRAYGILAKALAKRVGTAALVALTGTLLSGGILLPLIMGILTIYSAVEILQALDETEKELEQTERPEPITETEGQSRTSSFSPSRAPGTLGPEPTAPYAYAGSEQSLPHEEAMRRFAAGGYNHGRTIEFRDPTTGQMASGVHRVHEALINPDIVFPEGSINLRDPEAIRGALRHFKERASASDYFSSGRAAHDLMRDEFDVASKIARLEQQIIDAERFQANARAGTIQGFDRSGRSLGTLENESSAETRRLTRVSGKDGLDLPNGVSENLINTIKQLEGFSAKAYSDEKQYSIGYGTKANSQDEVIDEAEAEKRLIRDLNERQKYVIDYAKRYNYDWNQNQIDSLTSFIYNLGKGALDQVTAGGTRSNQEIIEKMLLYNKAGGEVKGGLVTRRATEVAMFTGTPQMSSVRSRQVAGIEPGNIRNAGLSTMAATNASGRNANFRKLEPIPVYIVDGPGSSSSVPGRLPGISPSTTAAIPPILDEKFTSFLIEDKSTFSHYG